MKIKTSELIGQALDWAVSVAMGYPDGFPENLLGVRVKGFGHERVKWRPSTDWAQGGPIIEKEDMKVTRWDDYPNWTAYHPLDPSQFNLRGPTILIAAMRCYVASKLGDEVEVPDDLMGS